MEVPDKAGNGVRGLGEPLGSIYFENWYKSFLSILTFSYIYIQNTEQFLVFCRLTITVDFEYLFLLLSFN